MGDGESSIAALKAKLSEVDGSEAHILAVSGQVLALSGGRAAYEGFAEAWFQVLEQKPEHSLQLLYVANDVLQRSKMKKVGDGAIPQVFKKVLPKALKEIAPSANRPKLLRVLSLWAERGVYKASYVKELKKCLQRRQSSSGDLWAALSDDDDDDVDDRANKKDEDEDDDEDQLGSLISMSTGPKKAQGDVPMPRLLALAKSKAESARALLALAEAGAESGFKQLKLPVSGGSVEKGVLAGMSDEQVGELLKSLCGVLKECASATGDLRDASTLEEGLLGAIEQSVENASSNVERHEALQKQCNELESRLAKLKELHADTEGIEMVRQVEKRVRKAPVLGRKRGRTDKEEEEEEEEGEEYDEDDEDDDEDDDEESELIASEGGDGQQDKRDEISRTGSRLGERKGSIFKLAPRKKRKKKVKKEEKEEEVPMMYNKVLKKYVPVPMGGSEESWRDH